MPNVSAQIGRADTVLEYGDAGPELIEDYLDDVKELLGHA